MKLSQTLYAPLLLTGLLISCGQPDGNTSNLDTEINGNAKNLGHAKLGQGFYSDTGTFSPGKGCVESGETVFSGQNISTTEFKSDLDFKSTLDKISGGLNGGVQFGIFNLKGEGSYASAEAADEFSSTVSLTINNVLKTETMSEIYLSKRGKQAMLNGKIYDQCGDEFINSVTWGSKLFVNVKFHFQSAQDKEEFKGKASVSLAAIGELGGQLEKLDDRVTKTTRVTITAQQIGGDTEQLGKVIPDGIFACDLERFKETCLPMLNNIIAYTKDGYVKSLQNSKPDLNDPKGWSVFAVQTEKYKNAGIEEKESGEFVSLDPNHQSMITSEINLVRDQMYAAYDAELKAFHRASQMLQSTSLTPAQRSKIESVKSATDSNRLNLIRIGEKCSNDPSTCVTGWASYQPLKWEKRVLSLQTCLEPEDLVGSVWNFNRVNTKPNIIPHIGIIRLAPGGKIELPASNADVTWTVEGCLLRFFDSNGVNTSTFDDIKSVDLMTGIYHPLKDMFRHELKRMDPNSDAVKAAEKAWADSGKKSTMTPAVAANMAAALQKMAAEIASKQQGK